MTIFSRTPKGFPRRKLKDVLRRIPDFSKRLTPQEKIGLEKEAFPSFFGREISKKEVTMGIENLRKQRCEVKDLNDKAELESKIKVLKKLKKK